MQVKHRLKKAELAIQRFIVANKQTLILVDFCKNREKVAPLLEGDSRTT
jgi:hypothetical protein